MKRITLATFFASLLILTLGVGATAAAPVKNPNAEIIQLDCESGELEVVVTNGNPAHVIGSTQRLIPHEFTFGIAVDDVELFSETETVGQGAKKGLQDRLITCTGEFAITDPDELAEIQAFLDEIGAGIDVSEAEVLGVLEVRAMPTGQ